MSINIDFYNENSQELTDQYNSVPFEKVHGQIIPFLPKTGKVLDVGCGSGRDAFALAEMGLEVTAVDPAKNMLNSAKENFSHKNITFVEDSMPSLKEVKSKGEKYDFILLSAVWMHIEEKDRKEAFDNLKSLLSPNGKMAIYLRHGRFEDDRKEIPVSLNEVELYSDNNDIQSKVVSAPEDTFKRDVYWELIMVENKPRKKLKPKRRHP